MWRLSPDSSRRPGVGRGDVVAVMLPNRAELLLGLMAAWRLGAAATPINPVFTPNEAGYQIADSAAKLLLASDANADYGVPVLAVDDLATSPAGRLPAPDTKPDDLALLIYTSGSTGGPKGVMLDHANLVAMGASIGKALKLGPDDRCLLVLPLFHVNAILVSCLAPIMAGGQVMILARFAPDTFLATVAQCRATYFSAVPTIYARLAEVPAEQLGDLASVRFAVCGAAPVSKQLLHRSESRFGFPIIEGYGLTEGTCASTLNPLDGARKPGTVGVALPGQQVATMRAVGSFASAGEPGEVVIRGANVMRAGRVGGVCHRPQARRDCLAGPGPDRLPKLRPPAIAIMSTMSLRGAGSVARLAAGVAGRRGPEQRQEPQLVGVRSAVSAASRSKSAT